MHKTFLLAVLCLAIAAVSPAASANPFETTLANGLRVIVKEDHRAPTVVHMVWYRAGSIDEVDGTSGVAHVLEHMMFKGTRKVGPGEFSKRVAAVGGRDNAFTNYDYTAYYEQVPKRALPEMMALEADRMANLKLDAKEFAQEIKVVMEERRMRTDDNPQALVQERLNSVAFQAHPYRRPVIGWMNDLENMTYLDARDWYQRWYAPNNATVVVVGDVDHAAVFRLAEKTYGGIKRHVLPERRPLAEPEQLGIKRLSVKAPAKLPYLEMAWKVPKLKDVEHDRAPYALEMLAAVLDGNVTSRLPKHLVREQKIAQTADAGYDSMLRGEAQFVLDGQPAEGHTAADLEAALRAEIKRIQDAPVSAGELERIKTQIIASQIYKRDSMMGQAMEIGSAEVTGYGWRNIDRILDKIRGVTAEEVQAAAKKYFQDDALTVAVLDPQPLSATQPRPPPAGLRH
ncbi:MAG: insulinase family protein [Betaproteobacteria bacterium]|nr:insulinase family protein [Betaproteobacteria bacterium]